MAHRWIGVAALLVVGCMTGDAEVSDPVPVEEFETVVIDQASYPDERIAQSDEFAPAPIDGIDPDPCMCEGNQSCIEDWADTYLGCNICVVLICDEQTGPHVCHACQPPQ